MSYSGNFITLGFILSVKTSCMGYEAFVKENHYKRALINSDEPATLEPKTSSTVILVRSLAECAVNTVDKSGMHFLFNKDTLECIIETVDTLPGNVPKGYTRFDPTSRMNPGLSPSKIGDSFLMTGLVPNALQNAMNQRNISTELQNRESDKTLNECYYSYPKLPLMNYENAMMDCQKRRGYIIQIDSFEEQGFIETLLSRYKVNNPVWLGRLRVLDNGNYTWEDREEHSFEYWDRNNPQYPISERNCVVMVHFSGSLSPWRNINCFQESEVFCEFDFCSSANVRKP